MYQTVTLKSQRQQTQPLNCNSRALLLLRVRCHLWGTTMGSSPDLDFPGPETHRHNGYFTDLSVKAYTVTLGWSDIFGLHAVPGIIFLYLHLLSKAIPQKAFYIQSYLPCGLPVRLFWIKIKGHTTWLLLQFQLFVNLDQMRGMTALILHKDFNPYI